MAECIVDIMVVVVVRFVVGFLRHVGGPAANARRWVHWMGCDDPSTVNYGAFIMIIIMIIVHLIAVG